MADLPAMERSVVFQRGEGAGKVEQLLMAVMEDRLESEGKGDEGFRRTTA